MGQLTQTTAQVQTILDNSDAANVGKTSLTDSTDTTAVAVKKSGFYSLGASSSNAPSTDRAILISAVRDTTATGEIRYGQVAITESNGMWWNRDDGGTLGTWYEAVSTAGTQTLTNKTLTSPILTTPQLNDTSADHQYIFAVSELVADRTVTMPLLTGNDTFVFEAHTQTLTNKTLTSPVLNTSVSGSAVLDEDDMSSNSATQLATQQSIKAYVDSQVGSFDTLAEVLAQGNTTGSTDIVVTAGQSITTDTVAETTADAGVTIDSLKIKDGQAEFANDKKALFGAAGELEIYSDGTDSFIKETHATGSLFVYAKDFTVKNNDGSESMLNADVDGGVQLFHNNAQKLATTTTGVGVTGTLTAGVITIDSASTFLSDLTLTGANYNVVWDSSADALEFADNAKAAFGAGSDLQIYHDGSNSYINDSGTGNLLIRAADSFLLQDTGGKTYLKTVINAQTELSYNNSTKLATTSTGATISNTTNPVILLDTTTAGTSTAEIQMEGYRGIADIGRLGQLSFLNARDGDTQAKIEVYANGDTEGFFTFYSATNNILDLRHNVTVFNEGGNDSDFRVESDNQSKMLFVDGGNDRVGIATTPNTTFHVVGPNQSGYGTMTLEGNADEVDPRLTFYGFSTTAGTTRNYTLDIFSDVSEKGARYDVPSGYYQSWTIAGSKKMTLDSSGNLGISDDTPENRLTVVDTDSGSGIAVVKARTPTTDGRASYQIGNDAANWFMGIDGGNSDVFFISDAVGSGDKFVIGSTGNITQTNTSAGASEGPLYNLYRNSASPADNDELGVINFKGKNDAAEDVIYATIESQAVDVTDATEDGRLFLTTIVGGTKRSRLDLRDTETVINEGSVDLDFRVESDTKANAIFVNAGTDEVNFDGARTNFGGITDETSDGEVNLGLIKLRNSNTTSGEFLSIDAEGTSAGQNMTHYWYDGSYRNRFSVAGNTGETTVNDSSADIDFRVESDSNANMLVVDAGNNRVGVGTNGPSTTLHVHGAAGDPGKLALSEGGAESRIFATRNSDTNGDLNFQTEISGSIATRMKVDYSGNLLVGQTTASSGTVGSSFRADGRAFFCADGSYSGHFNRNTSDGAIVHFAKNDTIVGTHATWGGYFATGQVNVGFLFDDSGNQILPWSVNTNLNRDDVIDLGDGLYRWKNLYLSGGVYLGGTGAANYLDDYEEGTWTPTYTTSNSDATVAYTTQRGKYTKVGNLVFITWYVEFGTVTSAGTGNIQIGGVPFGPETANDSRGSDTFYNVNWDSSNYNHPVSYLPSAVTAAIQYLMTRDNGTWTVATPSTLTVSTGDVVSGSMTYRV